MASWFEKNVGKPFKKAIKSIANAPRDIGRKVRTIDSLGIAGIFDIGFGNEKATEVANTIFPQTTNNTDATKNSENWVTKTIDIIGILFGEKETDKQGNTINNGQVNNQTSGFIKLGLIGLGIFIIIKVIK